MPASPVSLLDSEAAPVATLLHRLNRQLQPLGVEVKGSLKGDRLSLLLEGDSVPPQEITVAVVRRTLTIVPLSVARSVKVYGRSVGEAPSWQEGWKFDHLSGAKSQPQLCSSLPMAGTAFSLIQVKAQPDSADTRIDRQAVVGILAVSTVISCLFVAGSPVSQSIKSSGLSFSVNSPVSHSSASPIATAPLMQTAPFPSGFRIAINKATLAANQTQTAGDRGDWRQVADLWQESITLLETVATTDKNYAIAQRKIPEYQRNFVYAQQRLQQLPDAASLGMTTQTIQAAFQQSGFHFETATPIEGQARVTGRSPNGFAMLELLGASNNLTKVTIVVGLPPDDAVNEALSITYLLGLLQTIFPQWQQSSNWLSHGIKQLSLSDPNSPDSGNLITVRDNKRIKLSAIGELGTIVLAIEPE
jgi:hypothetical protein